MFSSSPWLSNVFFTKLFEYFPVDTPNTFLAVSLSTAAVFSQSPGNSSQSQLQLSPFHRCSAFTCFHILISRVILQSTILSTFYNLPSFSDCTFCIRSGLPSSTLTPHSMLLLLEVGYMVTTAVSVLLAKSTICPSACLSLIHIYLSPLFTRPTCPLKSPPVTSLSALETLSILTSNPWVMHTDSLILSDIHLHALWLPLSHLLRLSVWSITKVKHCPYAHPLLRILFAYPALCYT